jgi:hypothetical protein
MKPAMDWKLLGNMVPPPLEIQEISKLDGESPISSSGERTLDQSTLVINDVEVAARPVDVPEPHVHVDLVNVAVPLKKAQQRELSGEVVRESADEEMIREISLR